MTTLKSYTDINQSKKLATILPIETADMWYQYTGISIKDGSKKPIYFPMVIRDCESDEDVPCWSLAALLSVLPEIQGGKPVIALDDNYITYPHMNNLYTKAESPVDACVAMIEKLNEFNLL